MDKAHGPVDDHSDGTAQHGPDQLLALAVRQAALPGFADETVHTQSVFDAKEEKAVLFCDMPGGTLLRGALDHHIPQLLFRFGHQGFGDLLGVAPAPVIPSQDPAQLIGFAVEGMPDHMTHEGSRFQRFQGVDQGNLAPCVFRDEGGSLLPGVRRLDEAHHFRVGQYGMEGVCVRHIQFPDQQTAGFQIHGSHLRCILF